jgi:hypothetical protein
MFVEEKLRDKNAIMAETRTTDHKPCPTFVVTTCGADGSGPPILFRSYNSEENDADICPIWNAARATSAAPSFSKPCLFPLRPLVDGMSTEECAIITPLILPSKKHNKFSPKSDGFLSSLSVRADSPTSNLSILKMFNLQKRHRRILSPR